MIEFPSSKFANKKKNIFIFFFVLWLDSTEILAYVQRAINWFQHLKWWCEQNVMFIIWNVLLVNNVATGNIHSTIRSYYGEWHRKNKKNFKIILNEILDFVLAIVFICVIIKFCAKMIMPIVKSVHHIQIKPVKQQ